MPNIHARHDGPPTVMTAFIPSSSGPHARSARPCVVTRRIRQCTRVAVFRPWPPERHTGYDDVVRRRGAVCETVGLPSLERRFSVAAVDGVYVVAESSASCWRVAQNAIPTRHGRASVPSRGEN
jgi:hypothetical protein